MEPGLLSSVFLSAGPAPVGMEEAALEDRLRSLFAAGQAAWPTIAVDAERFARHLGRCARAARDPTVWIGRARGVDLYLACACAGGIPAAIALFEAQHLALLPAYVASFKLSPARLDEVRQEVRARILVGRREADRTAPPRIADYAGDGPLGAWVQTVARRIVLTDYRRELPDELDESTVNGIAHDDDPELELIKRQHKQAFEQAVRDALAILPPEQRTLLRLSYLDGIGIDRLAGMFDIHRSTAARRIEAAERAVRGETLRLLQQRLGLTENALASFIGALSNFHVSIAGALRAIPEQPA